MAETLPVNFAIPGEGAIASYDYYDIIESTGIKTFYPAIQLDSTGTTYILTANSIYGSQEYTSGNSAGNPAFNQNFDLTFNMPKTIAGTAIINAPLAVYWNQLNGMSIQVQIVFTKVSGITTTNFGSGNSDAWSAPDGTGSWKSKIASFSIVLTETDFKKGDKLRITIKLVTTISNGGGTWVLGLDPKARNTYNYFTASGTNAQFSVYVPFRLNL